MLDQVVAPRSLGPGGRDQRPDGVELVVAREDHILALHRARALRVLDLLLAALDEDVGADDIEEALPVQHLLPKVAAAVARAVLGVAGAAADGTGVASAVKGQEARPLAGEARRHMDLVGVGGEMDEGALLETEDRSIGVAVLLVLADGVGPTLAGHRVLELAGCHRYAVEREDKIEGVAAAGTARDLPRDGELVAREPSQGLGVQPVRRFEGSEAEGLAVELEAVPQDVQRPLEVELLHQRIGDHRRAAVSVEAGHLRPLLGLGLAQEGDGARGKQRPLDVPLAEVARAPAAGRGASTRRWTRRPARWSGRSWAA